MQEGGWAGTWAERVEELHEALEATPAAAAALSSVLASHSAWPRFATALLASPGAAAAPADTSAVPPPYLAPGSGASDEAASVAMDALVAALVGRLGLVAVFGGGDGQPHRWASIAGTHCWRSYDNHLFGTLS